jgi:ceramide glucosyltransferase
MLHSLARIIEVGAVLGAISGIAYYLLCIWSAAQFLKRNGVTDVAESHFPPVSILKPLKGTDPEMYESFRSHCLQDYPEFEIVFGVSENDDPVVEIVERLKRDFPGVDISLVLCSRLLGSNIKVSNLAQMAQIAKHDYLLVNDSDIRVPPDYVKRVMRPLRSSHVGLVTCLYRGIAGGTVASSLEAVGISTDFSGGVLAARFLEGGVRFGLGSTLAFRRRELQAVGGFESLVDHLADDYELGAKIAEQGKSVELADVVVETFLPAYSWRGFMEHQLRWARSVRDSRRWGYIALGLTFGVPWALLALLVAGARGWAWALLAATLLARCGMAVVVGWKVLSDPQVMRRWWLIPLRDIVALFLWIASFAGHKVRWRGDSYLLKNGKLVRIRA